MYGCAACLGLISTSSNVEMPHNQHNLGCFFMINGRYMLSLPACSVQCPDYPMFKCIQLWFTLKSGSMLAHQRENCGQCLTSENERIHIPFFTEYPDDLLQAALASFSAGADGPESQQLAQVEQGRHSSSLGLDEDDIDEDEVSHASLHAC